MLGPPMPSTALQRSTLPSWKRSGFCESWVRATVMGAGSGARRSSYPGFFKPPCGLESVGGVLISGPFERDGLRTASSRWIHSNERIALSGYKF